MATKYISENEIQNYPEGSYTYAYTDQSTVTDYYTVETNSPGDAVANSLNANAGSGTAAATSNDATVAANAKAKKKKDQKKMIGWAVVVVLLIIGAVWAYKKYIRK